MFRSPLSEQSINEYVSALRARRVRVIVNLCGVFGDLWPSLCCGPTPTTALPLLSIHSLGLGTRSALCGRSSLQSIGPLSMISLASLKLTNQFAFRLAGQA